MTKDMYYILSPCGTSVLTNHAGDDRRIILKYANEKEKENIPAEDRAKLEDIIKEAGEKLRKAELTEARRMSAELNAIIGIYDGRRPNTSDFHKLISTDTWLGKEAAELVKSWIRVQNNNARVNIHVQKDLQTDSVSEFQLALTELVKALDKEVRSYSGSGYKVIFNLTGGFKSVQGFLQSIANFLADETVYIFQRSNELLRIPRLPVKLDALSFVEDNMDFFRNIEVKTMTSVPNKLPETFIIEVGGEILLSPWGTVVWRESRADLYKKRLWPSPASDKIRFSKRFEKAVEALSADRRFEINKRIDELNTYFWKDFNPNSLNFKPLSGNPKKGSTHEFYAWSDGAAKRIFGHYEDELFVIDELGDHL